MMYENSKGDGTFLMLDASKAAGSSLLGEPNFVAVERALAEFRAGRPVVMIDQGAAHLVLPADGLGDGKLSEFLRLSGAGPAALVITRQRAHAVGIDAPGPVALALAAATDAATIRSFVLKGRPQQTLAAVQAPAFVEAALDLAKLAHRLPAVLMMPISDSDRKNFNPPLACVDAAAVGDFRHFAIDELKIASEARIPLQGGINARFIVFRGILGGESAAIIVNEPDFSKPVTVRLHSACLTGDVFGSRRCDCGDQLRLALAQLASSGGGVILYLDQEGRGLGLANKMRAYALQDTGLDTIDANMVLGFDEDERDYGVAARMLEMIGCQHVRLMTNNPAKIEGLTNAGIEIVGRVPLLAPVHSGNRRYLTAKASRARHRLDHLFESLGAADAPPGAGNSKAMS